MIGQNCPFKKRSLKNGFPQGEFLDFWSTRIVDSSFDPIAYYHIWKPLPIKCKEKFFLTREIINSRQRKRKKGNDLVFDRGNVS